MDEPAGEADNRRGLRLIGVLLLAGAALWGALLLPQIRGAVEPVPTATPPAEVASGSDPATKAAAPAATPAASPVILKATPWTVAGLGVTPTATAEPTTAALEPVSVLGPPPDSNFALDERVTFYWTWPEPLEEGQGFAVYLQSGSGENRIGVVEQANLGQAYQLTAELGSVAPGPGQYLWQVRLEVLGLETPLARSEPRAISLREG